MVLLALGAKFELIRRYGSPLPNIDQFYAEARALLIPLHEGTLRFRAFFVPHNEHRIVFTRLINLGLTLANRQWDPILEMVFNAGLDAALVGALAALAWRLARGPAVAAAAAAVALLYLAPTAWENSLGGFQSQFYLMEIAALAQLWLLVPARPLSGRWWAGYAVGFLALGTMASGFFSTVAALAVTLLALAAEPERRTRSEFRAAGLLLALSLLGVGFVNRVPEDDVFRAESAGQWLGAVGRSLAWPGGGGVLYLPLLGLAIGGLRARRWERADLLLLGLGLWSGLQLAGQAFSRGQLPLLSRYTDLFALGLVANLLALPRLFAARPALGHAAVAAWTLVLGWGIGARSVQAGFHLERYAYDQFIQMGHVRSYVISRNRAELLAVPVEELPYPNAARLASVLVDPGLLPLLPAEIRAPLVLAPAPATRGFAAAGGPLDPVWSAPAAGTLVSQPLPAGDRLPFLRFRYIGGPATFSAGRPVAAASRPDWSTLLVPRPDPGTGVLTVQADAGGLSFSAPAEMGAGSWAARELLRGGRFLAYAGAAVLLAAAAGALGRPRPGR